MVTITIRPSDWDGIITQKRLADVVDHTELSASATKYLTVLPEQDAIRIETVPCEAMKGEAATFVITDHTNMQVYRICECGQYSFASGLIVLVDYYYEDDIHVLEIRNVAAELEIEVVRRLEDEENNTYRPIIYRNQNDMVIRRGERVNAEQLLDLSWRLNAKNVGNYPKVSAILNIAIGYPHIHDSTYYDYLSDEVSIPFEIPFEDFVDAYSINIAQYVGAALNVPGLGDVMESIQDKLSRYMIDGITDMVQSEFLHEASFGGVTGRFKHKIAYGTTLLDDLVTRVNDALEELDRANYNGTKGRYKLEFTYE